MSGLPRVVIDSSTLIGAVLRPVSTPRQAFLVAVKGFELCVSPATMDELQDLLTLGIWKGIQITTPAGFLVMAHQ